MQVAEILTISVILVLGGILAAFAGITVYLSVQVFRLMWRIWKEER